jgi:hypothetical protein
MLARAENQGDLPHEPEILNSNVFTRASKFVLSSITYSLSTCNLAAKSTKWSMNQRKSIPFAIPRSVMAFPAPLAVTGQLPAAS